METLKSKEIKISTFKSKQNTKSGIEFFITKEKFLIRSTILKQQFDPTIIGKPKKRAK